MDVQQHGERKGTPFEAARAGLLGQTVGDLIRPQVAQAEGVRFDQGKAPMHLLPPDVLLGVAQIYAYGAGKYAPRNWELGMDWSRVYDSLMRHILAFWAGEDLDEESGMPHVDHIVWNAMTLSAYQKRNVGQDDRHALTNSVKAA